MKFILENWNKFLNEQRVVSFDFDETLHYDYTPNKPMIKIMLDHHKKGDLVIIMTARHKKGMQPVYDFVQKHKLPVSKIYHTNMNLKGNYLKNLGCYLHYDDNASQRNDVSAHGIEARDVQGIYS
jgi:hydroxymethylpyrimidine pyrophosphatase-like HAD family hydrolase